MRLVVEENLQNMEVDEMVIVWCEEEMRLLQETGSEQLECGESTETEGKESVELLDGTGERREKVRVSSHQAQNHQVLEGD